MTVKVLNQSQLLTWKMRKENDTTVNQDHLAVHFQAEDKVAQKPKSRTRNMFHHYKLTGLEPHEFTL